MAVMPAETLGENIVSKTRHKYWSPFRDYLYICI